MNNSYFLTDPSTVRGNEQYFSKGNRVAFRNTRKIKNIHKDNANYEHLQNYNYNYRQKWNNKKLMAPITNYNDHVHFRRPAKITRVYNMKNGYPRYNITYKNKNGNKVYKQFVNGKYLSKNKRNLKK